jgi:hypothetical protein
VLISILKMNVMRKCFSLEPIDLMVDLIDFDRAMLERSDSKRSKLGPTVGQPTLLEGGVR